MKSGLFYERSNEISLKIETINNGSLKALATKLRCYYQSVDEIIISHSGRATNINFELFNNLIPRVLSAFNNLFSIITHFDGCSPLHTSSYYSSCLAQDNKKVMVVHWSSIGSHLLFKIMIDGKLIDADEVDRIIYYDTKPFEGSVGGQSKYYKIERETLYNRYFNELKHHLKKTMFYNNKGLVTLVSLGDTGLLYFKEFIKFFKLKNVLVESYYDFFNHIHSLTKHTEVRNLDKTYLYSVLGDERYVIFDNHLVNSIFIKDRKYYHPIELSLKLSAFKWETTFPYTKINKYSSIKRSKNYFNEYGVCYGHNKLLNMPDTSTSWLMLKVWDKVKTSLYHEFQLFNVGKDKEDIIQKYLNQCRKLIIKGWVIMDDNLCWVDMSYVMKINFTGDRLIARLLIIKPLSVDQIKMVKNFVRTNILLITEFDWVELL